MKVGNEDFSFEHTDHWAQSPPGWELRDVTGIAVDSQDQVYVFNRSEHPIHIYSKEGRFLRSWGEGLFKRPHGIAIGPDDSVYCVGDWDHSVRKFTPDGDLLLTIERAHQGKSNGFKWNDPKTIREALPPFHFPTDTALSAQRDIYVSDGYGNARVHVFTPEGQLRFSWGEPGRGPGQFMTVHDISIDRQGLVYIADRENSRIQVFDPDGKFQAQWTDLRRPNMMAFDASGNMYITEMGRELGGADSAPLLEGPKARVTVRNRSGEIQAEWSSIDAEGKDLYFAPHGIAVDSQGDVYVGEVAATFSRGKASPDRTVLHKYVRL